jgi:phenylacetate-CoA ligase
MTVRSIVYFALHAAIGSGVRRNYKEMLNLEKETPARLQQLQRERLEGLLKYAVQAVPFYRERVSESGNLSLRKFPILTKEDIRNNFTQLMSPELKTEWETGKRKKGYSWVKVQTGGTTGMPTTVIHEATYRDRGRAGRLYSQYLCGFPLGTPYFRLWGSMREINEMRDSPQQRVLHALHREEILNAFRMSDESIAAYIKAINESSVQHIMAYVDALEQLARWSEKNQIAIRPLKSIMACAGTVTYETRRILRETFQARVHNQYGSRDCAGIACECDRGGHHIYTNQLFVEIVDDEGRPVQEGRPGRILVTLLHNFQFPIIRYDIGDIGVLATGQCRCGRPFPLFERVEGRAAEFLRGTEGGYISPVYIRHLIGVVHNSGLIRKFQLEQKSHENFVLRYERGTAFPAEKEREILNLIRRDLLTVLGSEAKLAISCVEEIPLTGSEKFLYTKRNADVTTMNRQMPARGQ